MERLLVVDHFVISMVGGEGVLLCPFSHADFVGCNLSDLACCKKKKGDEI